MMSPASATKNAPLVNSLGMKFVPVAGTRVIFSIWDTRVQDYAAFAAANAGTVNNAWKTQEESGVPVSREPQYPVVGVNWPDVQSFCEWLTQKEGAEGRLPKGAKYRLPTDEEWSIAAGMPAEKGAAPVYKDGQNTVDFPWGRGFPPKAGAGNYADSAFHGKFPQEPWIARYTDGYVTTSPVGSFPPNGFGLYDMGGNVWQICEGEGKKGKDKSHVMRGGAWNESLAEHLLSSQRKFHLQANRRRNIGFRCVLQLAP